MTSKPNTTNSEPKLRANPERLLMWTKRNKCWMCKRKFDKPVVLPVDKSERGVLQPNINVEVSVHMVDTHGMPARDYVHNYVFNSIYGIDNTMANLFSATRVFKIGTGDRLDD